MTPRGGTKQRTFYSLLPFISTFGLFHGAILRPCRCNNAEITVRKRLVFVGWNERETRGAHLYSNMT